MGTISGCRHIRVNLKTKIYIYVNSSTQRCPNKIIKIFLIEDFFHLPPVSTTPVGHVEVRISSRIFKEIWNGPNSYTQGLLGNWFMKKTRSRKSRGTVPLINFMSSSTETKVSHSQKEIQIIIVWLCVYQLSLRLGRIIPKSVDLSVYCMMRVEVQLKLF